MEKLLRVAEMRDLDQQVAKGEISYSRMVEIINEKSNERFTEILRQRNNLEKLYFELREKVNGPAVRIDLSKNA
jgi:hypothetical protein